MTDWLSGRTLLSDIDGRLKIRRNTVLNKIGDAEIITREKAIPRVSRAYISNKCHEHFGVAIRLLTRVTVPDKAILFFRFFGHGSAALWSRNLLRIQVFHLFALHETASFGNTFVAPLKSVDLPIIESYDEIQNLCNSIVELDIGGAGTNSV